MGKEWQGQECGRTPASLLQTLAISLLDNHDLHFIILISPVEEGDAGVVAQACILLGVLDFTQQLHDLLCSVVLGGQNHPSLSLHSLNVVSKAHLSKVFGERKGQE